MKGKKQYNHGEHKEMQPGEPKGGNKIIKNESDNFDDLNKSRVAKKIILKLKKFSATEHIPQNRIELINALHSAVRSGNFDIVKDILRNEKLISQSRRAMAKIRTEDQRLYIFSQIIEGRHYEPQKIIDVSDGNGYSSLMLAAKGNHNDILKYLLKYDADINYQNFHGRNAMHIAAYWGACDAIKTLAFEGLDVNKEDQKKNTPLLNAVLGGQVEAVRVLINNGADLKNFKFEFIENELNDLNASPYLSPQRGLDDKTQSKTDFCMKLRKSISEAGVMIQKTIDDSKIINSSLHKRLNKAELQKIIGLVKDSKTHGAFDYIDNEKNRTLLSRIMIHAVPEADVVKIIEDNLDLITNERNLFFKDYKGRQPLNIAIEMIKNCEEFIPIAAKIAVKMNQLSPEVVNEWSIAGYFPSKDINDGQQKIIKEKILKYMDGIQEDISQNKSPNKSLVIVARTEILPSAPPEGEIDSPAIKCQAKKVHNLFDECNTISHFK